MEIQVLVNNSTNTSKTNRSLANSNPPNIKRTTTFDDMEIQGLANDMEIQVCWLIDMEIKVLAYDMEIQVLANNMEIQEGQLNIKFLIIPQ